MKSYTHYVGLDVHADSISVAIAGRGNKAGVESLGNVAHAVASIRKVLKKHGDVRRMKVCYEAGACGYALYWELTAQGIDCEVIAPSLIPQKASDKVKTDRKDAEKLARLLRAGELTAVWVPDREHEALRDLVRAREACKRDKRRAQQRVEMFLMRHGLRAPLKKKGKLAGKGRVKSFCQEFVTWLGSVKLEQANSQATLDDYRSEVVHQTERLKRIDAQINEAIEHAPSAVREVAVALQALRGVAEVTAAVIAVEVGHFSRFDKAPQLMSWAGLTPREYSSGGPGRANRYGLTKAGNVHLRRALTEAAWLYRHKPQHAPAVLRRRQRVSNEVLAIAQKAETRLHSRYKRMSQRNKLSTKIASAIARELLGFVWAIGCEAERVHAQKLKPTADKKPKERRYIMQKAA